MSFLLFTCFETRQPELLTVRVSIREITRQPPWQEDDRPGACCHGNPYMFLVALDASRLSLQHSKLRRSWKSIHPAGSRPSHVLCRCDGGGLKFTCSAGAAV